MGCIPLMHDDDRIRLWSDPSTVGDRSTRQAMPMRNGPQVPAWQVVAGGGRGGLFMANFITS
jgi:hypothetical protein